MQLRTTGHHVEVTDALRAYVDEKVRRLERHFDHMTNVHVILSIEKKQQKAEATVHASGAEIFADATHENMYAAIDSLADKLDRQILKHKEKIQNKRAGAERVSDTLASEMS
ncbi:MAG: ribosome hibernation-promoting factor, HPF/YfiA family [bacterium]